VPWQDRRLDGAPQPAVQRAAAPSPQHDHTGDHLVCVAHDDRPPRSRCTPPSTHMRACADFLLVVGWAVCVAVLCLCLLTNCATQQTQTKDQGESNHGQNELYSCRYEQLMKEWRREWHTGTGGATDPDMPMGFVQIGPMTNDEGNNSDSFLIRMGQTGGYGFAPNQRRQASTS
jgi:hypothetical protein